MEEIHTATMDIVEEIRNDGERGAKRLEAEYRNGLMTLAMRICHDSGDAAELVNRTFAEVIANIDHYAEQSAFFGWMSKILVNIHAKDSRRKSHGDIVYPGEVPEIVDEDATDRIYREVDASLLRDAIDTLPNDIKKTLLLHYFMDMPVKDVARFLAIPSGTVMWRLHYARQMLAAKLGAATEKPGGKAVLLALLLFGLTALGAATFSLVGTSGRDVSTKRPNADALGSGRIVDASLPGAAGQSTSDIRQSEAFDFRLSTFDLQPTITSVLPQGSSNLAGSPRRGAEGGAAFSGDNMKTTTRSAALGAATALALAAAPPAATADYQFIVSGDPGYDPPASQLVSAGGSLVAGPLSKLGPADALEARSRTSLASVGTGLRSDAYSGFSIIIR